MIRHSVLFSLRYAAGSTAEKNFLQGALLLAQIPGVQQLQIAKQTSAKNNFQFSIAMLFADAETYHAYTQHALHDAFIETHWKPGVSGFLEVDLEPLPLFPF